MKLFTIVASICVLIAKADQNAEIEVDPEVTLKKAQDKYDELDIPIDGEEEEPENEFELPPESIHWTEEQWDAHL